MITSRHLSIAIAGFVGACGGDSTSGSGDSTTGDDPTGSTSTATTATTATTDPTLTTVDPSETADTTAGPPDDCARTIRYPLFDGLACGRVLVGDIDGDGFGDAVAFGRDPAAVLTPVTTQLHTFVGGNLGLESAEVHCCVDTSIGGPGVVFDMNGDGRGDPIFASELTTFSGDVGSTELTMAKIVRGPQGGYTGSGVLFGDPDVTPAFAVGRITPQEIGVLVVADGALISMIGNGVGLGLEEVRSLPLDPFPTVWALATIELDGEQGVDVAAVGPDGLLLWGGSLDGTFTAATVTKLPGEYRRMVSVDLDLNGSNQLVLFGDGEPVALVEGDGDGGLTVTTTGTPTVNLVGTVIEVSNDLYPDLVAKDGGNLVMYAGDGTGFAADPTILAPIGDVTDIAYGDFDGDMSPDVVACDEQGLLVVYRVLE